MIIRTLQCALQVVVVAIVTPFPVRNRLAEAKGELDKIMTAEQLALVPVVILGNKIDIQVMATDMAPF